MIFLRPELAQLPAFPLFINVEVGRDGPKSSNIYLRKSTIVIIFCDVASQIYVRAKNYCDYRGLTSYSSETP